jgi:hypothetical protein
MLAHAEIIVGAPDHDLTRALGRMPDRAGKSACDPLKVGEHAIAPLVPQAPDRVCEKLVIVHEPASGSREVSNSPRNDHLLQLAIFSSGS